MKNKEMQKGQAAFSAEMVEIWTNDIKTLISSPDFISITPYPEWNGCSAINVRGREPRRVFNPDLNKILKDMGLPTVD